MPQNYTGSTTGITARQNVTISNPIDTDVRSSASVRTPLEVLANIAQYLMAKAGLIDTASTWTAKQTMSGGVGGLPEPGAGSDAATKTYADGRETTAKSYADGLITALKAAANTWTAKHTFSAGLASAVAPSAADDVLRLGDLSTVTLVAVPAAGGNFSADATAGLEPRCWKGTDGVVRCRGRIVSANGATTGSVIGTLPVGYRPAAKRVCFGWDAASNDGVADVLMLEIGADGTITPRLYAGNQMGSPHAANTKIGLDGISFLAGV